MLELSLVVKCYSSKSRADYWRMSEMKLVRDERDGLMYRLNCGCTGRSSRDRHGFSQHHKRWQVTVHLQLDHSCPQTRSTVSWSSFGVVSGFLTSFRPIHTHNSNLCQTSAYKITRVRPYAPWIPPHAHIVNRRWNVSYDCDQSTAHHTIARPRNTQTTRSLTSLWSFSCLFLSRYLNVPKRSLSKSWHLHTYHSYRRTYLQPRPDSIKVTFTVLGC